MAVRNGWRSGRHLVVDDESGKVLWDDQVRKRWDGALVESSQYETRHPQEFVKAKQDPYPLKDTRPDSATETPANFVGIFVGQTSVPVPTGPASHLFDPGIGEMIVGTSFYVR